MPGHSSQRSHLTNASAVPGPPGMSGVGGGWTPLALGSKLSLWLDERGLTPSAGPFSAWADQSGNGRNFSQAAGPRQPVSSAVAGFKAPDFDGSDDYVTRSGSGAVFFGASGSHWSVLLDDTGETPGADNASVAAESPPLFFNAGGSIVGITKTTSGPRAFANDGTVKPAPRMSSGVGKMLLDCWHDGTILVSQKNDEDPVVAAVNALALSAGTESKIGNVASAGGAYFPGRIASVLTANGLLSSAERASLRLYLAQKYGVLVGEGYPSPLVHSALVGAWEADAGVTLVGSDATSWADLSGRGNHLTDQGIASRRPRFSATLVNGQPGLEFDGVAELLSVASLNAGASFSTGMTVVALVHVQGTPSVDNLNNDPLWVYNTNPRMSFRVTTPLWRATAPNGTTIRDGTANFATTARPRLVGLHGDPGGATLMRHHEHAVLGNSTTWAGTTPPDGGLFVLCANQVPNTFLRANIAAVYIFRGLLTTREHLGIYERARTKGWLP